MQVVAIMKKVAEGVMTETTAFRCGLIVTYEVGEDGTRVGTHAIVDPEDVQKVVDRMHYMNGVRSLGLGMALALERVVHALIL